VAEGDGAAVDVDAGRVGAELSDACDRLRREGLIELDEIDVVDGEPGTLEDATCGGHGPNAHHIRCDTRYRGRDNAREWLMP
jgi:hypothetical protein